MKRKPQSKHFVVYTFIVCLSILLLSCSVMNTHLVVMGVVETQHMAIDLGTSSMKVASLRSTQHYHKAITSTAEVILNDQSNRKSPSCVAFRPLPAYRIIHESENYQHNNISAYSSSAFANLLERSFAESAEALEARFPEQVICSPTLLLDQSQRSSASTLNTSSSSCPQFIDQTHEWNKHFPFSQLDQSFFVEQASASSSVERDQHDEYNYPFFYKTALSSECNNNNSNNARLAVHLPLPKLNSLGHEENNKLSTPHSPAFASYEVEEVIAMLLQYAQRLAENADMHDSTLSTEEYVQLFDFTKSTSMNGNSQNSNKVNHAHNRNKNDDENEKEVAEIYNNTKRDKIKEIAIPPRHPIQSVTLTIPTNTPLHVIQRLHDAAEMAGFTSIDFKSSTMSAAITLAQLRPQLFTANKSEKSNKNSFSSYNNSAGSGNVVNKEEEKHYSEEEKYAEFYKLYEDTHPSLRTDPKLYNESTFVMIYDMGYAHTEAAVFAFNPYKRLTSRDVNTQTLSKLRRVNDEAHGKVKAGHATRDKKLKKYEEEDKEGNAGVLELITSITNNKLGGRDFDLCIANYWDRTFLNNSVFNSTLISRNKHQKDHPNGQIDTGSNENSNVLFLLTSIDEASVSSIFSHQPREVLKRQETLLRAARRTREMLSVNSNVPVTVEGIHVPPVHQTHDSNSETNKVSSSEGYSSTSFSTALSRETFETECNHLFQQAIAVRDAAVQSAREWVLYKTMEFPSMPINKHEIEMIKLDRIEVIGGATRMPRLLYLLEQPTNFSSSSATNQDETESSTTKKYNKKDNNGTKQFEEVKREINIAHSDGYRVGRTLNADEAIVLGAVNSASTSVQKEVYVLDKLTTNILFGLKNLTPSGNEEIQHEQKNKAIGESGKKANNSKTIAEDLNIENNVKEEMFTLFEAYKYTLLSVKTIRLENRTNDLIFSLYEEEENEQEERRQLNANYADHLIRSYAITGVSEVVKAAKQLQTYERVVTWYNKTTNTTNVTDDDALSKNYYKLNRNMSLSNSFVIIETLVGENGMPRLNKAYLLATYNVNGLITLVNEEELQKAELITEEEANLLNRKGNHSNMKAQTVNIDITHSTKDSDVNKQDTIKKVLYYEVDGKLDFYNVNEVDYVFPLHIEVIHHEDTKNTNCGPVMSSSRKQQGQITVHEWQKVDFTRLHCSALRNQLEELLGETKFDVITLQTQIAQREAQRVTEWRSTIRTLVDWMEDESERATVHELEEQIDKVKSIRQQVRALERQYEKEEDFK